MFTQKLLEVMSLEKLQEIIESIEYEMSWWGFHYDCSDAIYYLGKWLESKESHPIYDDDFDIILDPVFIEIIIPQFKARIDEQVICYERNEYDRAYYLTKHTESKDLIDVCTPSSVMSKDAFMKAIETIRVLWERSGVPTNCNVNDAVYLIGYFTDWFKSKESHPVYDDNFDIASDPHFMKLFMKALMRHSLRNEIAKVMSDNTYIDSLRAIEYRLHLLGLNHKDVSNYFAKWFVQERDNGAWLGREHEYDHIYDDNFDITSNHTFISMMANLKEETQKKTPVQVSNPYEDLFPLTRRRSMLK